MSSESPSSSKIQGLSGAFTRYRVMAWITGVVLATAFVWLIVGRLFLDYGNPDARPAFYGYLWIAHGWLYFIYLITGVDLAFRVRYSVLRTVGILIAGTIPFASFVSEALVHKDLVKRGLL
jgi:integral membrane protein